MSAPVVPADVVLALSRHPARVRKQLLDIRLTIFATASATGGVGPLTETLKWGEPAYLTEKTRSGTTIRLGISKLAPDKAAVFFNCRTNLVENFRAHFADTFDFEGNRALIVPASMPLEETPLALCLRMALTYHRRDNG
ncbi:hypothetical protein [Pelagibacterium halotolerans]|uniref:YdhG-like domain-containing protein n=1 Tax=Pelagibacterium halotolerans (strain DSM 22347 / JCM 15775 / CGMCC 1.7692 / B2) TaxID=1082931 RepID=G4R7L9_PELHB|nr:hypothetical protein [Pelagibacterium halotolerans]AEQ52320.1 hypothetical protein KKY_2311 [Pelagibacterium halotolerans B2]QJR17938.1 DUF1801 domain-containing protein [Pelagibacterium halotolerans]SEA33182.1 hypothetical protein SAMN05428936_10359 [Pelagibacterium halotolerans]